MVFILPYYCIREPKTQFARGIPPGSVTELTLYPKSLPSGFKKVIPGSCSDTVDMFGKTLENAGQCKENDDHFKKAHLYTILEFCGYNRFDINTLRPSDAICRHRSWSTLFQVMACCLNQYGRLNSQVLWYSFESNCTAAAWATILYLEFEKYTCKIIATYPGGQ